ncbi:hypothetical protein Asi03nite_62610 [Actinoplanes siamensis]|uniref:HTH cro/C1-type domain-containing protein n=2 Tax=Actinoplanes siamensis TaxID=1223317 RepID=A0A919TP15_9ACTN|nr:hypothetical protein Asi03nite_62610 [Actinoplanes siamensis]
MRGGLTQRVSTELRAEMGRQRISQRELARRLGVNQAVISRRLAGEQFSFTTAELDRIAEILGVPVDRFLTSPVTAGAA